MYFNYLWDVLSWDNIVWRISFNVYLFWMVDFAIQMVAVWNVINMTLWMIFVLTRYIHIKNNTTFGWASIYIQDYYSMYFVGLQNIDKFSIMYHKTTISEFRDIIIEKIHFYLQYQSAVLWPKILNVFDQLYSARPKRNS